LGAPTHDVYKNGDGDGISDVKQRVKQYIILNTSRKHVNYEEDKIKVPMNKPYKPFADVY
jgi:hypothetical protein